MGNTVDTDRDLLLRRTEYMSQFMTGERVAAFARALEGRTRWMSVCMENMFHPQNASALVRNCEAFGIQEIHAIQNLCKFSPNVNIVRGTDKWIDIRRHQSTAQAIEHLRKGGYRIVATAPGEGNATPESFDVARSPFVLVFGTEKDGVSEQVMASADELLTIPMCGLVESLNVSASAAILLYALSSRLRRSEAPWQIDPRERERIMFRWMMSSIRDSERILARFKEVRK